MNPQASENLLRWSLYHKHLKISDRRSFTPIPYHPNPVQKRLNDAIVRQHKAGKPVRLIVLKSRRMGVSTHVQARFAHLACTTLSFHGITGAHLDESSQYLHGMTERMIEELPPQLKPPKRTGIQGKRIEFQHGATLRTFTAGGRDGVGRATGANALHGSEVAFWPDAKSTLTALLQIIPDETGTISILESTANGIGDEWHTRCVHAMNGEGDYEFFFAPWYEFPDYAFDAERAGEPDELSHREQRLANQGVSWNQLAWRRWAIQNLCGGDPSIFDQEYPDTPEVAFLTSGRPFFAPEILERVTPQEPRRVGRFEGSPQQGGGIRFVDDSTGPWRIWEAPHRDRSYILFADVAGSVTLDEYEARALTEKGDYCAASLVDRETGRQVAAYHARIDPDLYGVELARAGYIYNTALVAVENTGGYGIATLATLHRGLGYSNLYKRRALDRRDNTESQQLGWDTNSRSRPAMLDHLRSVLRDDPGAVRDSGFVGEARTFVVHSNGKAAAASGCHDDRVMSVAGALQVWREVAEHPVSLRPKKKRVEVVESRRGRASRIAA